MSLNKKTEFSLKEITAYHEAGHAVMYHLCGFKINYTKSGNRIGVVSGEMDKPSNYSLLFMKNKKNYNINKILLNC